MAVRGDFKQAYDEVENLNGRVEGVMKCAVDVAEDMQEDGEQYGSHVDQIERYLLDFAKLAEDVKLRKQALEKVSEVSAASKENEEPPDLSQIFLSCLDELHSSRKETFDPNTHPIVMDFTERVRGDEEEEEEEGEDGEEGDLVVGQVDRSLKCPLTKAFLVDPVTSKLCKHTYSSAAIRSHIRQRKHGAKCPVCGHAIQESDLVQDKKVEKLVRRAQKKQKVSSRHTKTGVVKL